MKSTQSIPSIISICSRLMGQVLSIGHTPPTDFATLASFPPPHGYVQKDTILGWFSGRLASVERVWCQHLWRYTDHVSPGLITTADETYCGHTRRMLTEREAPKQGKWRQSHFRLQWLQMGDRLKKKTT